MVIELFSLQLWTHTLTEDQSSFDGRCVGGIVLWKTKQNNQVTEASVKQETKNSTTFMPRGLDNKLKFQSNKETSQCFIL